MSWILTTFTSRRYYSGKDTDDVLMIWQGPTDLLTTFLSWINTLDPNLRFTHTCNSKEVIFLDLVITKEAGKLTTKTHQKPTAKNNLLNFTSFHPRPLEENLPYGQYLRLRRNCSAVADFKRQSEDLTTKLKNRDYSANILTKSYKRAHNQPCAALLEAKSNPKKPIPLTCVTTYSAVSNSVKKVINKHWRILTSNTRNWDKLLFSFKKGHSLKDSLVHTRPRLQPTQSIPSITRAWGLPEVTGHYPCSNCSVCHLTSHTKNAAGNWQNLDTKSPHKLQFN